MSEEKVLYASFSEHFNQFRKLAIQSLLLIGLGTLACFLLYQPLLTVLTAPAQRALFSDLAGVQEQPYQYVRLLNADRHAKIVTLPPEALGPAFLSPNVRQLDATQYEIPPNEFLLYAKKMGQPLLLFGPLEGMAAALKISGWGGTILTSPAWLLLLMRFIFPGLKKQEKKGVLSFLLLSLFFIALGALFGWYVSLPLANRYLALFNQSIGTNFWSLNSYLEYSMFILFANALAFELAVLGIFAVSLGIVDAEYLAAKRKTAILAAFIVGACLTPPDIFSQILLALPLISLYELLILFAKRKITLFKSAEHAHE